MTDGELKIHSDTAWNIASQWSWTLASDTRTLAAQIDVALSEALAQRDAAFEMSKCECGPDEACRNLVEASATGRREGMEAIIAIAEDYANDAMPGSGYRLACVDIAAAIRAAMEKEE